MHTSAPPGASHRHTCYRSFRDRIGVPRLLGPHAAGARLPRAAPVCMCIDSSLATSTSGTSPDVGFNSFRRTAWQLIRGPAAAAALAVTLLASPAMGPGPAAAGILSASSALQHSSPATAAASSSATAVNEMATLAAAVPPPELPPGVEMPDEEMSQELKVRRFKQQQHSYLTSARSRLHHSQCKHQSVRCDVRATFCAL